MLRDDGRRLAEVAGRCGLDARVPTCPGWQVRDLLCHLGGVHRWAASHIANGRPEPYPPAEEVAFFAAVADDAAAAWTVYLDAAGHRFSPGRHPAELVVTGPASDFYLLLWNRAGAERLDTRGDLRALDSWRAHARIRWA